MQTVEQTRDWLLSRARVPAATDTVDLLAAAGRVLAQDLVSALDVPPCDNSAMDGYAVRVADAAAALPVSQRIPAGSVPQPLLAASAARIFTGALVPPLADAVVMQEQAEVAAGWQRALHGASQRRAEHPSPWRRHCQWPDRTGLRPTFARRRPGAGGFHRRG